MSKRYRHRQFKLFGRWFSFTRFDGMTRIHWWRRAQIDGYETS